MAESKGSILADNLFFLTGAFARKLSSEADGVFSTMGLATSHALILLLVRVQPGIQPSLLADKLHLKPSTITRLVQKLERRNLVVRTSEGRSTSIVCTSEGIEKAELIEGKWQDLISSKKEELGERYVEVLSEMIGNAIDTMGNN